MSPHFGAAQWTLIANGMKKGDIVLVRASRNEPGVRRIWDPAPERPYVCLEDYWNRWQLNGIDPVCPQMDRSQLFQYEAHLAQALEEASRDAVRGDKAAAAKLEALWKQAKPAPR